MKRPKVAFWLSFLLIGAGLCYVGRWRLAVANFVGTLAIGVVLVIILPEKVSARIIPALGLGLAFASGVWADMEARRHNAAEEAQHAEVGTGEGSSKDGEVGVLNGELPLESSTDECE